MFLIFRIECQDITLRKYLHLTTEDLRFADYVVKHVSEERHDVFLDGVGYEGGDEWIRAQFRVYLLCLLRTSMLPGMFFFYIVNHHSRLIPNNFVRREQRRRSF